MNRQKTVSVIMAFFLTVAGFATVAQARERSTEDVDAAVLAAHKARDAAHQAMLDYRDRSYASPEEADKAKQAAKLALNAARKASKEAAALVSKYAYVHSSGS